MSLRSVSWAVAAAFLIGGACAGASVTIVEARNTDLAAMQVQGFLNDAAARARGSVDDGTTLVFSVAANGLVQVTGYDGRPAPNETVAATPFLGPRLLPAQTVVSLNGIAGGPPFAFFFGSDGSASAAVWSYGGGTIPTQPACNGALVVNLRVQWFTQSKSVDCASGVVQ